MPHQHFRNPLKGKPRTVEKKDRAGKPRFRIICRELTPLRAKLAHDLDDWIAGLVFCVCAYAWLRGLVADWFDMAMLAAIGLIGCLALQRAMRIALVARTEIEMTTSSIRFRCWFAWKSFNRMIEHRFALALHDKTADEAREMQHKAELAGRKGRTLKQQPFYGESYHVALVYGGHRVDLLEVYGERQASAIVSRLTYCDRVLNEAIAMTGGISKSPADDWADAPGGFAHE